MGKNWSIKRITNCRIFKWICYHNKEEANKRIRWTKPTKNTKTHKKLLPKLNSKKLLERKQIELEAVSLNISTIGGSNFEKWGRWRNNSLGINNWITTNWQEANKTNEKTLKCVSDKKKKKRKNGKHQERWCEKITETQTHTLHSKVHASIKVIYYIQRNFSGRARGAATVAYLLRWHCSTLDIRADF